MYVLFYSDGTEVVVKIFPKIDSSVQLQSYEKRLHGMLAVVRSFN